jgi:hypothetical protein
VCMNVHITNLISRRPLLSLDKSLKSTFTAFEL